MSRKPLVEMKTVRDRVHRIFADENYPLTNEATLEAALMAAQPVLDDARAEKDRVRGLLIEANEEIARLRGKVSDPVVVSRSDLVAYLNRGTGDVRREVEALNRLLAAAGIED